MQEAELTYFVESTLGYFEKATGEKANIGLPYVKKPDEQVVLDYTGIIGISGDRRGGIYITCTQNFLSELVRVVMATDEADPTLLRDMIGELANTISGNATRAFGRNFQISVPIVMNGNAKSLDFALDAPSYVIPANWRGMQFFIVVGISDPK